MKKSRVTQYRILISMLVAFVVVVCATATVAAAPSQTNQIHRVDVVQRGSQTVVTVKGSVRPMYTAFKLSTPKRLVLDLANSSLKGVPALLERSTALVAGVAVSEFTTGKVQVSRVMINFKKEASYRVKVKGSSLVVTLSGGPAAKNTAKQKAAAPTEQVISLANAQERIEKVQKFADARVQKAVSSAKRDVSIAQQEASLAKKAVKSAKKEVSVAQQEVNQAKNELASVKKEAATTKQEIASARVQVEKAQAGANQAEVKWRQARAEISNLKAKQAHYDAQLERAQKEAVAAQKELDRLQRTQLHKSKVNHRKLNQLETNTTNQIEVLTRKVRDAQALAKKEQSQRGKLEQRLQVLKAELVVAKKEAQRANDAKVNAEQAVVTMKESVRQAFLGKEQAKKDAKTARNAQFSAEKAYQKANQKDKNDLYAKLQNRQRETVEAKKRYVKAEQLHKEIDAKLDGTMQKLLIAQRQSRQALRAKEKAEKNARKQQNVYQEQLSKLNQDVSEAEAEAKKARVEKDAAIDKLKAEKRRVQTESSKLKKAAAANLKAAEQRVQQAEKAAKQAKLKTTGVVEKIREVDAQLGDANRTIVAQKKLISQLKKKAKNAQKDAEVTARQRKVAIQRAKEAVVNAENARQKAEAQAQAAEKLAAQAAKKNKLLAKQIAETKKAGDARLKQERSEKKRLEKEIAAAKAMHASMQAKAEEASQKASKIASKQVAADKKHSSMQKKAEKNTSVKKMTQEELRLQRLAQLQEKGKKSDKGKKHAVATKVAPVPTTRADATKKVRSTQLSNAIQDIKFVNKGGSQKVVINGSGEFKFSKVEKSNRVILMELKKTRLLPMLERTLDVRDFGGVIDSISSYTKNDTVYVEVKLGRYAKNKVAINEGAIEWSFNDSNANGLENAAPLGTSSRVVHREKNDAYAYPTERTAAYSVTLEDLSQRKEKYSGRRIDLDFKSADIHNILRLLADVGHVNIITSNDVSGTVTIRMRDVPWDQALDVILQTKGLGKVKQGNLIRVAPLSVLEAEYEKAIERIKMSKELKPLETRLIPVSYATAAELMPRANDLLSDRGKLSVDARTNVIIARDVAEILDQVEALIRNLDTQTPQVLIEGRIVEATSTYAREIGIQWGGDFSASAATGNPTGLAFPSSVGLAGGATDSNSPLAGLTPVAGGQPNPNFAVNLPAATGTGSGGALGISLGSIANNANLNLRLSAMEEEGTLRILSSPKILTLDNREAHIEQGTMIPYSRVSASGVQTSFKEAKLNLTVTPHVTADGSILLAINMTRDEPDFNNKGARGDPTILKREAQTELLVNDGHTAVIGGIFTRNHGRSYKKVPFFGDIPILGWLFKSRSDSDRRSEMLIFITPTIVNRAESIGQ